MEIRRSFRAPLARSVRWTPIGAEGLEHLTLAPLDAGVAIRSVVIGDRGGSPYGVRYEILCDGDWRIRSLDLVTTDGLGLKLVSDHPGRWADATGRHLAAFDGCVDIDLAGTPFTNTLPIRRLGLEPGQQAELNMLYVPFDSFEPTVDGQRYTCLQQGALYRYEAVDRSFAAELPVDEDGLVTDYPTLFQRTD